MERVLCTEIKTYNTSRWKQREVLTLYLGESSFSTTNIQSIMKSDLAQIQPLSKVEINNNI